MNRSVAPTHSSSVAGFRVAIFLLMLLAFGVAIRLMWQPQSFWVDETASAAMARQPLDHLWSDWMRRETNPPLYYTLLKGWTALLGPSDGAARLLSILEGCVATLLAYLLGRKVAGRWAGVAAAVLMTVSPAQVHYSLEVRGYVQAEMGALLALLGAVTFCQAGTGRGRGGGALLYGLGCVVGFYSHTMLALLPALANLWILPWLVFVRKAPVRTWLMWIAVNVLVLAAWAWWLSITLWQLRHAGNIGWIDTPSLEAAGWQVLEIYGPGKPFADQPLLMGMTRTLSMVASGIALLAMIWTCRRRAALVLAVCAIGAPLALFLISQKVPVMVPRVFFWALGPLLVSVAIGLVSMPRRSIGIALFAVLLLTSLAGTAELGGRELGEPFRQIVAGIGQRNPYATVIGNSMDSALSLRRYCQPGICRLSIAALRTGKESWSQDMPMTRIPRQALPAILQREGEIYVVFRSLKREAVPELAGIGAGVDISRQFGPANYVIVERWRLRR